MLRETCIIEEIIQDAFIKLWEENKKINNPEYFLKRIIKNSVLNYIRNNNRRLQAEQNYYEITLSKEEYIEDIKGLAKDINTAISELPEKTRKVFLAKCVEGHKYSEIAEDLDMTENTVKYHITSAYRKIKDRYNIIIIVFIFY